MTEFVIFDLARLISDSVVSVQSHLGKEADRIEASRVLGLRAAGGRAKTCVDLDTSTGRATEVAKRLGLSRRTAVCRRTRAIQSTPAAPL